MITALHWFLLTAAVSLVLVLDGHFLHALRDGLFWKVPRGHASQPGNFPLVDIHPAGQAVTREMAITCAYNNS